MAFKAYGLEARGTTGETCYRVHEGYRFATRVTLPHSFKLPEGLEGLLAAAREEERRAALRNEPVLLVGESIHRLVRQASPGDWILFTTAWDGGQAVGMSGRVYDPHEKLLDYGFVYVHPDHREKGLGFLLVREQFEQGKRLGACKASYIAVTGASEHLREKLKRAYAWREGMFQLCEE